MCSLSAELPGTIEFGETRPATPFQVWSRPVHDTSSSTEIILHSSLSDAPDAVLGVSDSPLPPSNLRPLFGREHEVWAEALVGYSPGHGQERIEGTAQLKGETLLVNDSPYERDGKLSQAEELEIHASCIERQASPPLTPLCADEQDANEQGADSSRAEWEDASSPSQVCDSAHVPTRIRLPESEAIEIELQTVNPRPWLSVHP